MLKEVIHNLRFIPQYLPRSLKSNNEDLRPFFGPVPRKKIGGPAVRLSRMRQVFGNHSVDPNIIYIGSAWNPSLFKAAIRAKRKGIKLVFNQNGWYYPGWYKGDWKQANQYIKECQKACDYVIYQSNYCLEAQKELIKWVPENYEIIHNCTPLALKSIDEVETSGNICWFSGVMNNESIHIFQPLMEAFTRLYEKLGKECPKLKMAVKFDEGSENSHWYSKISNQINFLKDKGVLYWCGEYLPSELSSLLEDVSVAIHLKYKDPCPNAVVERMAFGIPHIYSDSGGTPELVGKAGIPLLVGESWDEKLMVDSEELEEAILKVLSNQKEYKKLALERVKEKFMWENYIRKHEEIFSKLIRDN